MTDINHIITSPHLKDFWIGTTSSSARWNMEAAATCSSKSDGLATPTVYQVVGSCGNRFAGFKQRRMGKFLVRKNSRKDDRTTTFRRPNTCQDLLKQRSAHPPNVHVHDIMLVSPRTVSMPLTPPNEIGRGISTAERGACHVTSRHVTSSSTLPFIIIIISQVDTH